jgi:hypothetical protein
MQRLGIDADDVSMKLSVRAAGTATFPDELDAGFLQKARAVNRIQIGRRSGCARPAPGVAGSLDRTSNKGQDAGNADVPTPDD